jgi:methionine-S-sulfoxide reductase
MTQDRAVLAGGCFWGMQDLIRRHDGVISTRVGYTGGDVPNATYRNHGTHAEAIEIVFDPAKISYRRLLEFFFQPSTMDPAIPAFSPLRASQPSSSGIMVSAAIAVLVASSPVDTALAALGCDVPMAG